MSLFRDFFFVTFVVMTLVSQGKGKDPGRGGVGCKVELHNLLKITFYELSFS